MLECMNPDQWNRENKIYINKNVKISTSFSEIQQDDLYTIEDGSWWFGYRAEIIIGLLDRYFSKEKMLLDVGGGNGYTTFRAQNMGYQTALVEPTWEACANAVKRGLKEVYCGTVDVQSIKDHSIEQMMLLDVLEHIEEHKEFLELLKDKLVGGGRCLITVPAFMSLWSSEDVEAGHFRRYRLQEIEALAGECGFAVVYCNYFMQFLYLPILLVRVWLERMGLLKKSTERTREEQQRVRKAQFEKRTGLVDWGLRFFERIEMRKIDRGRKIRFGSSVVIILEKRE